MADQVYISNPQRPLGTRYSTFPCGGGDCREMVFEVVGYATIATPLNPFCRCELVRLVSVNGEEVSA